MTKTSIEIDNLLFLNERKIQFPDNLDLFSLTIAYLIKDFSENHNTSVGHIIGSIYEHIEIIKRCADS